jgi:toxin ParE1/3/4
LRRVKFSFDAEKDLQRIFAWFESKREGLGVEFLHRVDEAVDYISRSPEGAPVITGDVRRFPIQRQFTDYALWYRVRQDVIVIACLSGRRAPTVAQGRTSKPKR